MRDALTQEQRQNSFTDKELEMMIAGNNPQSNAWRELLAYRQASRVEIGWWSGPGAQGDSGSIKPYQDPSHQHLVYAGPRLPVQALPPELVERDATGQYLIGGTPVLPTWARGFNACRAYVLEAICGLDDIVRLPPHQYRELVNRLRDTAKTYGHADQLRERISSTLQEMGVKPDHRYTAYQ